MTRIFISHASEDKDDFVRPLARALKDLGLQIWYDEFSIRLGDSLRRSIDRGLAGCTAGVVVLSRSFFAKEWPQRELDALFTAEVDGKARILPIWHGIDKSFIASVSPLLADRLAVQSAMGVKHVADEIATAFPASAAFRNNELANVLERFTDAGNFATQALAAGCCYRFLLMNAFREGYCAVEEEMTEPLTDEMEDFPPELVRRLAIERDRLRQRHVIPENSYLTTDDPLGDEQTLGYLEAIELWASGMLSLEDSAALVSDLDHAELDEYYVLLGLPNFSFSPKQRDILEAALTRIGAGMCDNYNGLFELCSELRSLPDSPGLDVTLEVTPNDPSYKKR